MNKLNTSVNSTIKNNTFLNTLLKEHGKKLAAALIILFIVFVVWIVVYKKQIINLFKKSKDTTETETITVNDSNKFPLINVKTASLDKERSSTTSNYDASATSEFRIKVVLDLVKYAEYLTDLKIVRTRIGDKTITLDDGETIDLEDVKQTKEVPRKNETKPFYENGEYVIEFEPDGDPPHEIMLGRYQFDVQFKNLGTGDTWTSAGVTKMSESDIIDPKKLSLAETQSIELVLNVEVGEIDNKVITTQQEVKIFNKSTDTDIFPDKEIYFSPVSGNTDQKSFYIVVKGSSTNQRLRAFEFGGNTDLFTRFIGDDEPEMSDANDKFYVRNVGNNQLIALDEGDYTTQNPKILFIDQNDDSSIASIKFANVDTLLNGGVSRKAFLTIHYIDPQVKALANKIDLDSVALMCGGTEITDPNSYSNSITPRGLASQFKNSILRYGSTGDNFDENRPWCGVNKKGNNLPSSGCDQSVGHAPGWRHGVGSSGSTIPTGSYCYDNGLTSTSTGLYFKLKTDAATDTKREAGWWLYPDFVSKKGWASHPSMSVDGGKIKGESIGDCRKKIEDADATILTPDQKKQIKVIGHRKKVPGAGLPDTCFWYTSTDDGTWTFNNKDAFTLECKDPMKQWPCNDTQPPPPPPSLTGSFFMS
jgi:hypothetical protein